MKYCKKCNTLKEFDCFSKSKLRKDGYDFYCKDCNKKYREQNKEKLLENKKEYYKKNREEIRIIKKEQYKKGKYRYLEQIREYYSIPDNWKKRMYAKVKARAKKDNIPFTIDLNDIVIPTKCPILNIDLTFKLGYGQLESNASLDRIDNSLGYIKGNVQVISRKANTMKNNASKEELLLFSYWVLGLEGTTLQRYVAAFKEKASE